MLSFLIELSIILFGESIFEKVLRPTLKHIGAAFKFIFLFPRYSYAAILKRRYNATYGGLIILTIGLVSIWMIFS